MPGWRGRPFSSSTKQSTNKTKKKRPRAPGSAHATLPLAFGSCAWCDVPVAFSQSFFSSNPPLRLHSHSSAGIPTFFQTFFRTHNKHKSPQHQLKARNGVLWPPLTYIPRSAQCLMVYLKRGRGVPPPFSPPKPPWGLSLIGSLPSHVTLSFSIKNHRPISCFHTHR